MKTSRIARAALGAIPFALLCSVLAVARPQAPNPAGVSASPETAAAAAADGSDPAHAPTPVIDLSRHRPQAARLIEALTRDPRLMQRLEYLCDTFGPRLSGSVALERALDWILAEMQRDGLSPRGEPVRVPRWVRGAESLTLLHPREARLGVLALGGSDSTPPQGITAEVLPVRSFDELADRAAEARGKIVLFAIPFDSYENKYMYRSQGAIKAARVGAAAVLLRSLGPQSLYTPHTGVMKYEAGLPRLPAAAITPEDAEMLWRMHQRGQHPRVTLKLESRQHPDSPSRNIVAELRGSEHPDEIVAFGCHIDSWDVGQGAHDDGGACIATWHALLAIKELGIRPRRTIRAVLWVNEENGMAGAHAYARAHGPANGERHVLALEADSGIFTPTGIGLTATDPIRARVERIAALLDPLGAASVTKSGGGVDIMPLEDLGVPVAGLKVQNDRYFHYHHSAADTVDKIDPTDLGRVAAAMAVFVLGSADLL